MARKFLYIVAGLTVLVILTMLALRMWSQELTEMAFVPDAEFTQKPAIETHGYANPDMWISRPGLGSQDPSRWLPREMEPSSTPLGAAVFFVHPSSYFEKSNWNAPVGDTPSRDMAALLVQGMASAFNESADIWAPRYRQATFGAFMTSKPEGHQALDLAYDDVQQAFDQFSKTIDKDRPIVLAGHSQGAFHLRRLIRDRIMGTPLQRRIAAAYIIGWPVSKRHDLPAMGLPACATPDQPGCIASWLAVAEPAETEMLLRAYKRQKGLDGMPVGNSAFVCTNPLTGGEGGEAPASDNLGTLVPLIGERSGFLTAGKIGARCRDDGFLSIGPPPDLDLGPYVLPGNNYHLFDMPLFWANLRRDAANRVAAWNAAQ